MIKVALETIHVTARADLTRATDPAIVIGEAPGAAQPAWVISDGHRFG